MITYPIEKKEKLSGIYIIKNLINGKIYIGQSKNLAQRRNTHLSLARNITKDSQPIHKAIAKYGHENFVFYPLVAEKKFIEGSVRFLGKRSN